MNYARALLDELMGPNRNRDRTTTVNFWDDDVCKCFLFDYCPHDLFTNTKSDIGPCPKVHDDKLRTAYQQASPEEKEKYHYEEELFLFARRLLNDLDRKIKRAREKVLERSDENEERLNQMARDERKERMIELEVQIKDLQAQIERFGEEGMIDEARELSTQVEQLDLQLHNLRTQDERERRTDVCDVCGSLLTANDAVERIQAHLTGKQHTGYQKLRETFEALKNRRRREPAEDDRSSRYSGSRPDDRDRDRDRERDRDRDRGDRRDYQRRDRDGDRRREDYRGRDYPRDPRRRSRSPPRRR